MYQTVKIGQRRYRVDCRKMKGAVLSAGIIALLFAEAVWFIGWCRLWW